MKATALTFTSGTSATEILRTAFEYFVTVVRCIQYYCAISNGLAACFAIGIVRTYSSVAQKFRGKYGLECAPIALGVVAHTLEST